MDLNNNQAIIDDLYAILDRVGRYRRGILPIAGVTEAEHARNPLRAERLLNTAYAAIEEAIDLIPLHEDLQA